MYSLLLRLFKIGLSSIKDVLPILLVVAFFQLVVLQNPIADLYDLFAGLLLVLIGLAMFVFGLENTPSSQAKPFKTSDLPFS